MKLTEAQLNVLARADRTGVFAEQDRATCPGIHFCPDWDFLPICDASQEKEGCTCRFVPADRLALDQDRQDRRGR